MRDIYIYLRDASPVFLLWSTSSTIHLFSPHLHLSQSEKVVLDAFLPGYSSYLLTATFSLFHVDISAYLRLIVIFMAIGNSLRFCDVVKHDFTSTLQIKYDDEAYGLFILFWMTKQHLFQQVPHVVTETEARKDIAWYRSGDNNYNDIDEIELQKDMNFNEYWCQTVHREKSK